jgi:hypothetical protein
MKNQEEVLEYLLMQEEDVTQLILDVDQGMNSWDFTLNTLTEWLQAIKQDAKNDIIPEHLVDSLVNEMLDLIKAFDYEFVCTKKEGD